MNYNDYLEVNMDNISFKEIIESSRSIEDKAKAMGWSVSDVLSKSIEELGEFSEATQIERGKITNKPRKENETFFEAADVMICVIDALARTHKNMTETEICENLKDAVTVKIDKWVSKVEREYRQKEGGQINND